VVVRIGTQRFARVLVFAHPKLIRQM
jgi:hypothetical protein